MSASSSSILYSAVVPAYKEAGNLRPLTERITAAMEKAGHKRDAFEVLIVDDNSRDGSVEAVEALKKEGYPVEILVRTTERGLSSAVIAGMKKAHGQYLLCMDADLQHPPESVPAVFAALAEPGIEFTLGTRYMPGVAIDANWPLHRRIISWGARLLARPLMPFNALSDPMSGFFAIRRSVFDAAMAKGAVSGLGFKIALELFIKCRVSKFNEVGFSFGVREIGESKLTGKVMVQYLSHLDALMKFRYGVGFFTLAFVILALVALTAYKCVLPMMLGTSTAVAAANKRLV
jgi:dolichol-phosphate mannosyltransferase